ncbi:hypothetical protein U1Q18_031992 [Sarracenia purpurea var. burkii]
MEASSVLSSSSSSYLYKSFSYSKTQFVSNSKRSSPFGKCRFVASLPQNRAIASTTTSVLRASISAVPLGEVVGNSTESLSSSSLSSSSSKDLLPKIDKSGRFCSPRAARELALVCFVGSLACVNVVANAFKVFVYLIDFVLVALAEPGYEFDKTLLTKYNHMSFGGPPVTAETDEEADELMRDDDKESAIEAEVLSAPPKLVYSKLILRFARKLLVAVVDRWNSHVLVIDKVAPSNWKVCPSEADSIQLYFSRTSAICAS